MNQFKKAKVIILLANKEPEKGNLLLRHLWKNTSNECKSLWQYKETVVIDNVKQYITLHNSFRDWYKSFEIYNLYIISDDEIKEFDKVPDNIWLYDSINNEIFCKGNNEVSNTYTYHLLEEEYNLREIIATTNTSLCPKLHKGEVVDKSYPIEFHNILPQPSQQFIEKYIESYNKGEIITDVLVEYEFNQFKFMSTLCTTKEKEYNFKINPKDNTITIKKLKDSWNRKEYEKGLRNLGQDLMKRYENGNGIFQYDIDEWIEKNL